MIHEVRPGETMHDIARRYGVPIQVLLRLNPAVNPRDLRPGMRLWIPVPGPYGPGRYGPWPYGPGQYGPRPYGPGRHRPGPHGPGPYGPGPYGPGHYPPGGVIPHQVSPGETLGDIANIYRVPAEAIVQFNRLRSPDEIYAGEILLIPVTAR